MVARTTPRLAFVGIGPVGADVLPIVANMGRFGSCPNSLIQVQQEAESFWNTEFPDRFLQMKARAEFRQIAQETEGLDVIVLIAGLAGRTTADHLLSLARHARRSGALTLTFGVLPPNYEGEAQNHRAMATLATLTQYSHAVFTYSLETMLDLYCGLPSGLTMKKFYELVDWWIARNISALRNFVAMPSTGTNPWHARFSALQSLEVARMGSFGCIYDSDSPFPIHMALAELSQSCNPVKSVPIEGSSIFRMRSSYPFDRARLSDELHFAPTAQASISVPGVTEMVFEGYGPWHQALAFAPFPWTG